MNATLAVISPDALFLAGLLLAVWFALRWMRNRNKHPSVTHRSAWSGKTGQAEHHAQASPPSLEAWEVRMHELARDLSAQLDTKIRIVHQLTLRAEQHTARLEAAINRAQQLLEPIAVAGPFAPTIAEDLNPAIKPAVKPVTNPSSRTAIAAAELDPLDALKNPVS